MASSLSYVLHIRDLLEKGAPIGGIGVQGHMNKTLIDLHFVEKSIRRLWEEFGLPIWVTEFDWEGNNGGDHAQHAVQLDRFYRLCMR